MGSFKDMFAEIDRKYREEAGETVRPRRVYVPSVKRSIKYLLADPEGNLVERVPSHKFDYNNHYKNKAIAETKEDYEKEKKLNNKERDELSKLILATKNESKKREEKTKEVKERDELSKLILATKNESKKREEKTKEVKELFETLKKETKTVQKKSLVDALLYVLDPKSRKATSKSDKSIKNLDLSAKRLLIKMLLKELKVSKKPKSVKK